MNSPADRSILKDRGAFGLLGLGLCALVSAGIAGCGGDDPPPKAVPSAAQVRDYFALNDGSCWRYEFSQGSAKLYARVDMSGPNTTSVAGSTVYVRKFTFESGGLSQDWYLDTESDGEVHLLRSTTGLDSASRETRRYATNAPLFGKLEFDLQNQIELEQGDRFTTESATPELCTGAEQSCSEGSPERHEWTVASMTEATTPDGQEAGLTMNYRVTDDDGTHTEVYTLVPGKGVAEYIDSEGTTYRLCAWRVCDSAGACIGAPSCAELVCLP